jgi:phenylacetate-CoA ligase
MIEPVGGEPRDLDQGRPIRVSIGLHRVLALPVTLPLPRLVEAPDRFQPTYLNVYPSMAMWLADEQLAGRLRLSPQILVTAGELRTPAAPLGRRQAQARDRRP